MKKFRLFVGVSFFTLFVLVACPVWAQPGDPGDPGDDPVPITGLEILLVAGGALGGYKLLSKKEEGK